MSLVGCGAGSSGLAVVTSWMDLPEHWDLTQVPRRMIGTDAFQETPIVEVTRQITKHNYLVMDVKDIPRVIKEVFFPVSFPQLRQAFSSTTFLLGILMLFCRPLVFESRVLKLLCESIVLCMPLLPNLAPLAWRAALTVATEFFSFFLGGEMDLCLW